MQRQWWFLSAKRDGFSLSGAGGTCGFLYICALNGAQFLKLAVHKCFCFSLVSIPIRVLFLMSLPSWWTLKRMMCGGDKVALYFCFSLFSIPIRVAFSDVSSLLMNAGKNDVQRWWDCFIFLFFPDFHLASGVWGCAFPRAAWSKSSVLQGTKVVFNCDRLSALTEQMRKQ